MQFNYSIEVLKKAAFIDELHNLLFAELTHMDKEESEEHQIVIEYLERRIDEINEATRLYAN